MSEIPVIRLDPTVGVVPVREVPALIANALYPVGDDDSDAIVPEIRRQLAETNHATALEQAIRDGRITLRNRDRTPQPYTGGGLPSGGYVATSDLPEYLLDFGVGVVFETAADRELSDCYRRQDEERCAAGRYTLERAAEQIAENAGERRERILDRLMQAARDGELPMYEPGHKQQLRYTGLPNATVVREFLEEAYWDDLNAWIQIHEKRLEFRFPDPTRATSDNSIDPAAADEPWIAEARRIADEVGRERWERGEREITARNVADAVSKKLAENRKTWGRRSARSASNVRIVGLRGWQFHPPSGSNGSDGS